MNYEILMEEQDLNTLSKRLAYALEKTGTTQTELARRINVKKQAIQYLCASGTDKSKFAYHIAQALNINVDWLVTGKGEMMLKESPEQRLLSEQKVVPILQWGQIDLWISTGIDRQTITDWTTVHEKFSKKSFALKLKDNSMFPRFDTDTLIIVDPEKRPTTPCFVVVHIKKIHETVFRQLIQDDDKFVLYAFNEAGYKQLPLSCNDKILGCMVEAKWLVQ